VSVDFLILSDVLLSLVDCEPVNTLRTGLSPLSPLYSSNHFHAFKINTSLNDHLFVVVVLCCMQEVVLFILTCLECENLRVRHDVKNLKETHLRIFKVVT